MYIIDYNNGNFEKAETLKQARKMAVQFFRIAKNQRYGHRLNFFTPASIIKNGKMIYSIDNQGMEKVYRWNF